MTGNTGINKAINKFPVLIYCAIAFSVTWGLKLLYSSVRSSYGMPPLNFGLLASFGPAISAVILILATEGTDGFIRLVKSLTNYRIGVKWILLAAFFEPVIFGIITLAYWLIYGVFPVTNPGPVLNSIASYILVFTGGLFLWGVSEEVGWRGWLLPKLQVKMQPLQAALILAIIVSIWHINPNSVSEYFISKEGECIYGYFPSIAERIIISIPITMVESYIFNRTGGCLLLMLCYHSASNTSYFWIDGMFGVAGTDFFRISFLAVLVILAVIFTFLLLKQRDKVTFI